MLKEKIKKLLEDVLQDLGVENEKITVDYSQDPKHGDYASNVALVASKKLGKNPVEFAEELVKDLRLKIKDLGLIEKVEVAGPGFINFWIKDEKLIEIIDPKNILLKSIDAFLSGQKIFIEYAHPNTHKEMHIGHMRTLITGEAVARLAEAAGAKVFRANYQGDIGLHVAKALFGIEALMQEQQLTLEVIEKWSNSDKAHFLGLGYALGSREYETNKEAIDKINKDLYEINSQTNRLYKTTRQWSLDYYDEFYKRFYTKFDRLFFESEVADSGKKIVQKNIGKIFEEQNGAVVFPEEKYGLHTRVFITQAGNPTYEGKEMGNAFNEYEAFLFDKKLHVVGSEQAGYFQVVFKALELLDPAKFENKQKHLSMGMVQFADRKMSSRTGDVLRVDWLIDQVKAKVAEVMSGERIEGEHRAETIEQIAVGAIKYSVLQVGTGQNVEFDITRAVSLDGNSGPYLQYSYARTQSVLRKSEKLEVTRLPARQENEKLAMENGKWEMENSERELLRLLVRFPEIVEEAAIRYAPQVLCTYLFELAQAFNLFYQKHQILKVEGDVRTFRLQLTEKTGTVLKEGLHLLGIQTPEKM